MELIVKLLAAAGIMGLLDYIWLGLVAKKFYHNEIGKLLLDKANMGAAVLFYVLYVIGVVMFVINPALAKNSWSHAAAFGALFGLVAYATYDLTNLATLKGFSAKVVVVDLIWGMLITSLVATGAYFIFRLVFN